MVMPCLHQMRVPGGRGMKLDWIRRTMNSLLRIHRRWRRTKYHGEAFFILKRRFNSNHSRGTLEDSNETNQFINSWEIFAKCNILEVNALWWNYLTYLGWSFKISLQCTISIFCRYARILVHYNWLVLLLSLSLGGLSGMTFYYHPMPSFSNPLKVYCLCL